MLCRFLNVPATKERATLILKGVARDQGGLGNEAGEAGVLPGRPADEPAAPDRVSAPGLVGDSEALGGGSGVVSVVHCLAELPGEVSRGVMSQDAVESDCIVIPDGFSHSDPVSSVCLSLVCCCVCLALSEAANSECQY